MEDKMAAETFGRATNYGWNYPQGWEFVSLPWFSVTNASLYRHNVLCSRYMCPWKASLNMLQTLR